MRLVRPHSLRHPYILVILLYLLPNPMPLASSSITIILSPLVGITFRDLFSSTCSILFWTTSYVFSFHSVSS
ncbi:hypothetical protein EV401DRAFT_1902230 [Pisolithus croceorrhizus]|nr:hypothetical protein EV401DRAFT_1902230 [Pisolithus croceorrhizus]